MDATIFKKKVIAHKKLRKKHPQKSLRIFSPYCPELPKRPKKKNSCSKMWLIDQQYIKLGLGPQLSFYRNKLFVASASLHRTRPLGLTLAVLCLHLFETWGLLPYPYLFSRCTKWCVSVYFCLVWCYRGSPDSTVLLSTIPAVVGF